MSEIETHVFGAGLTAAARRVGFENARELMKYSGFAFNNGVDLREPFDVARGIYPKYYHLLHHLLDTFKEFLTFSYKERLFVAVQTYDNPSNSVLDAVKKMAELTKGKISWGLEKVTSKRRPVLAFFRALDSAKRRDIIFWVEVLKPVDTPFYKRVLDAKPLPELKYGGFVADLQDVVKQYDVPKDRLWRLRGSDIANTAGLRSILPEMVASYQKRSFSRWRFLWDFIPGKVSFLQSYCTWTNPNYVEKLIWSAESSCTEDLDWLTSCSEEPACSKSAENVLNRHYSDYLTTAFPPDPDCGSEERERDHCFIYIYEDCVWVPRDLLQEYRMYRLWQRRLRRLLIHYLYRPGGLMFKNIASKTSVGKPEQI